MGYEQDLASIGAAADAEVSALTQNVAQKQATIDGQTATIASQQATIADLQAKLAAAGGGGTTTPPTPTPTGNKLTWNPAVVCPLTNPTTVQISASGGTLTLDNAKDYIIVAPNVVTGPVTIKGGRNFRLIGARFGGRKSAPSGSYDSPNRGIRISDGADSRVIYMEGLYFESGTYLSDAIQFAIRTTNNVTAYVQNVRVDAINYGTQANVHADAMQIWGGPKELFVDGFVANNCTYQGFYWDVADGRALPASPHKPWIVRRVFLKGSALTGGARYLLADRESGYTQIVNDRVYTVGQGHSATDSFGSWPSAGLFQGQTPSEDFVPVSQWVGAVYTGPGYST